ncbi:OprD family porin [Photobacterium sagamiensis]|uniref:OprD family outer membrane porin n=1 Tax=Photobacterium sagamiensis TaxID=2910241 RepID=UPI003D143A72
MELTTTSRCVKIACLAGLLLSPIAQAEGLLEDSKLNLKTRNIAMYLYDDDQDIDDVKEHFAWAQGLTIDYQSGYLADIIGFDATYAGVIKLGANDHFQNRDLLRDNDGKAEGFNKISQIYAKAKLGDEDLYANLYGGWKELYKTGALTVSRSRAITSSYQGISGEVGYKGLRLRGVYTNRFSDRNTPEKKRFKTFSGKKIDNIITGDLSYSWGKTNVVNLFSGVSKDYLRRDGLEFKWLTPLSEKSKIGMTGYFYQNDGLDNWEGIPFDDKATHYNLNLDYMVGAWALTGSYAYTEAERSNGLGMFYWNMGGKNTDGNFNSKADGAGLDYHKDGETMVGGQAMYNMASAGYPGLMLGARANYGFGMEFKGADIDEATLDFLAMYKFQDKSLKGLSMMVGVGPGYSYAMDKAMNPVIENGDWKKRHFVAATFVLDYKFNLL